MSFNVLNRKVHYWISFGAALPMIVMIGSGLFLQSKKHWGWVQPVEHLGTGTEPAIDLNGVLAALRTVPEMNVQTWADVNRLDVRPGRGVVKAWLMNGYEVQVDLGTGRVLQTAYRRSDLIESIHDGSFFAGDWTKLGLFLPSGVVVLLLWISGLWMWWVPFAAKRRKVRRDRIVASLAFVLAALPAEALEVRLVDKGTGKPVVGAEVTIVGHVGSVRSDADGRFAWTPDPRPPFVLLVVLPSGAVAKPVHIATLDGPLTAMVEAVLSEEVTVAVGAAPSIEASPAAGMTMVTARDIQLRGSANLVQAIENVPGVNQVSEGHAAVPAVRGLTRGRTLILIDGSRVTSERRVGPSATFMDPAVVEGIDVARGPGSVAYGSDAFGGVISVRTRKPVHTGTQASGAVTFGSGIPERRIEATISRGFGTGGIIVAAHSRGAADYTGLHGEVLNSGWRDSGVLVRAERRAGQGLFRASWQGDFGRDIERPRNDPSQVRFYSPFENSHRMNASYERGDVAGFGLLQLSGFVGTIEQRTDQDRIPTPTRARDIVRADVTSKDFQVRVGGDLLIKTAKLEVGVDINGRYGLEAHDIVVLFDLAGAETSMTDNLSVDAARRIDAGAFAQIESPLGARVSAKGGLRVDRVSNVNEGGYFGDRTSSNSAAAGFGAVTVAPISNLNFTAQVSRGFRDPTLSDRYFRGPSGRGFITGNPDLEPETSLQFDVAARYAVRRVRLAAYTYHYRISNLVERFTTETDYFFFRNQRARPDSRGRVRSAGRGRPWRVDRAFSADQPGLDAER